MLVGLVVTPAASEEALPALTYSPWTKFCLKGPDGQTGEQAKNTCIIGADGSFDRECGFEVATALIEPTGETKKVLRVTLSIRRLNQEHGVRIIIDQGKPIERPFMRCFSTGCSADYEVGAELGEQLKRGRVLVIEAVDNSNSTIRFSVPLDDFAKAYDGPPEEPKLFKLISPEEMRELEKSSEEERKARLERCKSR